MANFVDEKDGEHQCSDYLEHESDERSVQLPVLVLVPEPKSEPKPVHTNSFTNGGSGDDNEKSSKDAPATVFRTLTSPTPTPTPTIPIITTTTAGAGEEEFVNVPRSNVCYNPNKKEGKEQEEEETIKANVDCSRASGRGISGINVNIIGTEEESTATLSQSGLNLGSGSGSGSGSSTTLASKSDDTAILAQPQYSVSDKSIKTVSTSFPLHPPHNKQLFVQELDNGDGDDEEENKTKNPPNLRTSDSDKDGHRHSLPSSPSSGSPLPEATGEEIDSCSPKRQILAALAANMGSMALGSVMAFTSTALPDLRKSDDFGQISQGQESWIGSIMLLGAVVSCPVAGLGLEILGRRRTMLFLTLPFLLGWMAIFFAQDLSMIYVGRFICGFTSGAFSIAAPVYVTETANPEIRGMLTSGFDMLTTVGILYIFVIGTWASWRVQALACALIPIMFHVMMIFMPESPRFLVEKNKDADAQAALTWLKCQKNQKYAVDSEVNVKDSQNVQKEFSELKKSVDESRARPGTWKDLLSLSVLKPTMIGVLLMVFQQLSGMDAVMLYCVDIFHSSGSDIDDNFSAIIVGFIQVCATVFAALVVDRCGRRLLFLLSGFFMVLSLGSMGIYFYLKNINNGQPPDDLQWLPLTSLMVYVVAFSIGFGPLPWLLVGEIIPSHVKGLAAGIVTITRWILGFVITLLFQDLMSFGEHIGYWFFAFWCCLSIIFVYFCVPETKGKTLDEVALFFNPSPPVSI